MRVFILIGLLLLPVHACLAQSGLYTLAEGVITFYSKAPLENISAENTKAASIINTQNNELAVRVPINKFEFPNKLMQEHFNENYMESDKYPMATFKGKINEQVPWEKPGTYPVSATGILTVHGVEDARTIKGVLDIRKQGFVLVSEFNVKLEDHNIDIPKIVFNKIAEEIAVKAKFAYTSFKKE